MCFSSFNMRKICFTLSCSHIILCYNKFNILWWFYLDSTIRSIVELTLIDILHKDTVSCQILHVIYHTCVPCNYQTILYVRYLTLFQLSDFVSIIRLFVNKCQLLDFLSIIRLCVGFLTLLQFSDFLSVTQLRKLYDNIHSDISNVCIHWTYCEHR